MNAPTTTPDPISIDAAFDSGNIQVLGIDGASARLALRKDTQSEFFQWFHFRVGGCAGRELELKVTGLAAAAYPDGWIGYRACVSEDRDYWARAQTRYEASVDGGTMTIRYTPSAARAGLPTSRPIRWSGITISSLKSRRAKAWITRCSGAAWRASRSIACRWAKGARQIWFIARQHPGEAMAEWWIEGALEMLADPADPHARRLRQLCRFHVVPNANPDGACRGASAHQCAGREPQPRMA